MKPSAADAPRCFDACINTLSGGELKRVQLAAELIRLLLGLSIQGCTVVLVTHGQAHADLIDRTVELLPGGVISQNSQESATEYSIPGAPTNWENALSYAFPVLQEPERLPADWHARSYLAQEEQVATASS